MRGHMTKKPTKYVYVCVHKGTWGHSEQVYRLTLRRKDS